MHMQEED